MDYWNIYIYLSLYIYRYTYIFVYNDIYIHTYMYIYIYMFIYFHFQAFRGVRGLIKHANGTSDCQYALADVMHKLSRNLARQGLRQGKQTATDPASCIAAISKKP